MSDAGREHAAPRALAAAALVIGIACGGEPPNGSLTAVSWGGAYARAVTRAHYEPFEAETGMTIAREDYNGGLAEIRTQVDTGNVHWDIVDLEMFDATRGCDEGLLELIPDDLLGPGADGSPAAEDFWPETNTDCGVGTVFYSTVVAYHPDRFPGEKPAAIGDFFDLEQFPGRRGMRRSPLVNLEFALLADGVATDQVYAVLDTQAGMERAFAKLQTIRDDVVWWEAGAQPPQMLADAEVVMSTAYNGRIFNAQVLENQPFVIVWDGQVLDIGQTGIVAGTPNLTEALEFLRFSSSAESMAKLAGEIAYSPTRRSALPLVTTHRETGVSMLPHLPTSPQNVGRVLTSDTLWWSDHLDEVNERFSAWLAR